VVIGARVSGATYVDDLRALLKKRLQDCGRFEFDRHGRVIG
jgi:hypothetical protein